MFHIGEASTSLSGSSRVRMGEWKFSSRRRKKNY